MCRISGGIWWLNGLVKIGRLASAGRPVDEGAGGGSTWGLQPEMLGPPLLLLLLLLLLLAETVFGFGVCALCVGKPGRGSCDE